MNDLSALYFAREILVIIFKHRKKVLLAFLVMISIVLFWSLSLPKKYEATMTIMTKFGREYIATQEIGDQKTQILNQESIINTEAEIITSRELCAKVIETLGIATIYPDLLHKKLDSPALKKLAIERFESNIKASGQPGTNLIKVSFTHPNPETAANSVNALGEIFKERHLEIFSDPKSSFFKDQADRYQKLLRDSEDKFTGYKQRYGIYSFEDERASLIKSVNDLQDSIAKEYVRLREIDAAQSVWTKQPDYQNDPVANQLQLQLSALEQKEQQLSEKYNETSLPVLNVQKEIRLVKQQLKRQQKQSNEQGNARMIAQVAPVKMKITDLEKRQREVHGRLQFLDSKQTEFYELKRDVATSESNYQSYARKLEEAKISDELDRKKMTNIALVESASVPLAPVDNKFSKKMTLALLIGTSAVIGFAFVCEYFQETVTTAERAAKLLDLPVLASVPRLSTTVP